MARQSDDRQCGGRPLEGKKKKVTLEQATSNASDDVHTNYSYYYFYCYYLCI